MPKPLSILHLISHIGPSSFGLGPVALNLALDQLHLGHEVAIWCLDMDADSRWGAETSGFPYERIRTFPVVGPAAICFSPAMERAIVGPSGAHFSLIHQHGIWTATTRVTVAWREKTQRPTIVTPHGSLQAWCLRKSTLKKQVALWAYERTNLQEAMCIHALSDCEKDACHDFHLANPIAVIPNGISEQWLQPYDSRGAFHLRHQIPPDKLIALFIGRITPIKGLPMLLRAIDARRNHLDHWQFLIAGTDEFNHQRKCERLVAEYHLEPFVRFIGPIYGDAKRDAFAAADLFVLPSHSEGAPILVLEALGAGVPVLTTQATPWKDLHEHHCGWWADISVHGITAALAEATGKTREELSIMGARGKSLVANAYSWRESALKTIALYDWLLEGGDQPPFVAVQ